MRDKDQVFIFNDAELKLIKATFAENDALLYSIRKVLLQFPLTPAEMAYLMQSMTPDVLAVVKKRVFPDLDPESPLGQLADYRTLLTQDLKTKMPDEVEHLLRANEIEREYLAQQMARLENIEIVSDGIQLASLRDSKDPIQLKAYLDILGYVDPMLLYLKSIAGQKEETVQQQKERMKRDSNK